MFFASIFLVYIYFPISNVITSDCIFLCSLSFAFDFVCFFCTHWIAMMWKLDFKPIKSIRNVSRYLYCDTFASVSRWLVLFISIKDNKSKCFHWKSIILFSWNFILEMDWNTRSMFICVHLPFCGWNDDHSTNSLFSLREAMNEHIKTRFMGHFSTNIQRDIFHIFESSINKCACTTVDE